MTRTRAILHGTPAPRAGTAAALVAALILPPAGADVLAPAGPAAQAVADIAGWLFAGAAVVFLATLGLLLAAWPGGGSVSPRRWLLGAGVAVPAALLTLLLGASIARMRELEAEPPVQAATATVVAHMWWWEVRYRHPDSGEDIISANELRLPAGRPVRIGLASRDVIHSFWVPALGGKVDMLPGRTTQIVLLADRPGVHRGRCAEFCGQAHAWMGLPVVAMDTAAFDDWLRAQAGPAPAPVGVQALRGRATFERLRCSACHTIRGLGPSSALGPDLTRVGSRLTLAAGMLPPGRDALQDWLADPRAIKPGTRMPAYGHAGPEALGDLAAYLEQLR